MREVDLGSPDVLIFATRKIVNFDFHKRGYLLPEGCEDLIDLLKLGGQTPSRPILPPLTSDCSSSPTVLRLAMQLKKKPIEVIADLMELNIFAGLNDRLDSGTVLKLMAKHQSGAGSGN